MPGLPAQVLKDFLLGKKLYRAPLPNGITDPNHDRQLVFDAIFSWADSGARATAPSVNTYKETMSSLESSLNINDLNTILAGNPFFESMVENPPINEDGEVVDPTCAKIGPSFFRDAGPNEPPARPEADRCLVEPPLWTLDGVEFHFFQVPSTSVKVLNDQPTFMLESKAQAEVLCTSKQWDIWVDYQHNILIYFANWVDPVSKWFANGERLVHIAAENWWQHLPRRDIECPVERPTRIWPVQKDGVVKVDDLRLVPTAYVGPPESPAWTPQAEGEAPVTVFYDKSKDADNPVFCFEDVPVEFIVDPKNPLVGQPTTEWQAFLLWELHERGFQFELLELDMLLRRLYPGLISESPAERLGRVLDLWHSVGGVAAAAFAGPGGGPFA